MGGKEGLKTSEFVGRIADGSIGNVELDKGGYWSDKYAIWVDKRFISERGKLIPEEREVVDILSEVGLAVGKVFEQQIDDVNKGLMYPIVIFEEGGVDIFKSALPLNPTLGDPYTITPDLNLPAIPYSHAYRIQLEGLNQILLKLSLKDSPSARALRGYIEAVIKAYAFDPERKSDIDAMHEVDMQWVQIPEDTSLLVIIEPSEVYLDPARVAIGQDPEVYQWAKNVRAVNQLGPWRNFFEFRLLSRDESMVSDREANSIKATSRNLFASSDDSVVSSSLEFRRLLLSSGNGAHPVKTAKNYPNFGDIRDNVGYKNILYTNMITEGVTSQQLPVLRVIFGSDYVERLDTERLIRGSALRVLAHEVNHPFRIQSDASLEELKATINGFITLMNSNEISDEDIDNALRSSIGYSFFIRNRVQASREAGDEQKQRADEAYFKADTILMNYFVRYGVFTNEGIDFVRAREALRLLSDDLERARVDNAFAQSIFRNSGSEEVWKLFGNNV